MAYDLTKAASLRVVKKLAEKVKEIQDKLKELQDKSSTVYWYLTSTTVSNPDSTMGLASGEKYYTSSLTKEQFVSTAESGKKISLILDGESYGEIVTDISHSSSISGGSIVVTIAYATVSNPSSMNNKFYGYNSYVDDYVFAFPYSSESNYSSSNTVAMSSVYIPFMRKSDASIKLSNRQIPIGTGLKLRDYKDIVIDDDYLKDYFDSKIGDGLGIMDDGTVGLTSIVKNAVLEKEIVVDCSPITASRFERSDSDYPALKSTYFAEMRPSNWNDISDYMEYIDRNPLRDNWVFEVHINGKKRMLHKNIFSDSWYVLSTKNGEVTELVKVVPNRDSFVVEYFADITVDSIVVSDFKIIVYNSNGEKIPAYTSADEGKVLKIVNGKPVWVSDAPEVLE